MADQPKAGPCSNCGCDRVSVRKEQGVAGRVVKTNWYRETIKCRQCGITVFSRSPGKGVVLWNKAAAAA